jgi:hypothetical protein
MRVRSFLAVGLALLVSALLPVVAGAGPYKVKNLKAISGPSPFPTGCPGGFRDETKIPGHELETAITVNRRTRATSSQPGSRMSAPSTAATISLPPRWTAARRGRGARSPASRSARGGRRILPATRGSRPAATAPSTSADSPAFFSPPIHRWSRSWRATRGTAGAAGRRRRRSLRVS